MEMSMKQISTKKALGFSVLKALIAEYLITAVILLILAFLLYKFSLPPAVISVGVIITYIVSTFFGGFMIGKSEKKRKFLWGLLLGILYFLILFLVSVIVNKTVFSQLQSTITVFLMCSFGGMLGGMLS